MWHKPQTCVNGMVTENQDWWQERFISVLGELGREGPLVSYNTGEGSQATSYKSRVRLSRKQGRKVKRSQRSQTTQGVKSAEGGDDRGKVPGKINMQNGKGGCDHVTKTCQKKKICPDVPYKGDQEIISTLTRSMVLSQIAVRAKGSQSASLCRQRD